MKILNYGSLNIDHVFRVDHIVTPGETIDSDSFQIFPGGKGLNQSLAAARAGAEDLVPERPEAHALLLAGRGAEPRSRPEGAG